MNQHLRPENIPFIDIAAQRRRLGPAVEQAVARVLAHCQFINGPEVTALEAALAAYCGARHVVTCASGTDALLMVLMAKGVGPGDAVLCPSFTFCATGEAVALTGATPVFVDVDEATFNIDAASLKRGIATARRLGLKPRGVIPVDLFGQSADHDAVLAVAEAEGLFVLDDAAQGFGASYKGRRLGGMGIITATSFFPAKPLGCYGDGGAIFTNDDELAKKMQIIANHGQTVLYYHDMIGVNSRLDSIQAAILRIKLRHLDEYAAARNAVAAFYDKAFAGNSKITTPARVKNSTHVFHQYTLQLHGVDRNQLREQLAAKGIPAMIYYPVPLHLQKAYLDPRYKAGDFPVTEQLCASVLSLPIHTEFDEETLQYITDSVLEFVR